VGKHMAHVRTYESPAHPPHFLIVRTGPVTYRLGCSAGSLKKRTGPPISYRNLGAIFASRPMRFGEIVAW
jgi:hypothetical protein